MAEVFRTVMPSEGNYTTFQAGITAFRNVIGSGNYLKLEAQGTWSSIQNTSCQIESNMLGGGATGVICTADAANKFDGTQNTGKFRQGQNNYFAFRDLSGGVQIIGLTFDMGSTGNEGVMAEASANGGLLVDSCGFFTTGNGQGFQNYLAGVIKTVNCLAATGNYGFVGRGTGSHTSYFCTAAKQASFGVSFYRADTATFLIKNCIGQKAGTGSPTFSGTFAAGSDHNVCVTGSSAPGANSLQAASSPFVNYTSSDYRIANGSAARNAGIDLSADGTIAVSTDFEGGARPSSPTPGFYEPPYVLSFSPADGATGVAVSSALAAVFSKGVAIGSGNWTVNETGGSTHDTVAAASVSLSTTTRTNDTVTIPHTDLGGSLPYNVQAASGVLALWAGIGSATTWNFTTVSGAADPLELDDLVSQAQVPSTAVVSTLALTPTAQATSRATLGLAALSTTAQSAAQGIASIAALAPTAQSAAAAVAALAGLAPTTQAPASAGLSLATLGAAGQATAVAAASLAALVPSQQGIASTGLVSAALSPAVQGATSAALALLALTPLEQLSAGLSTALVLADLAPLPQAPPAATLGLGTLVVLGQVAPSSAIAAASLTPTGQLAPSAGLGLAPLAPTTQAAPAAVVALRALAPAQVGSASAALSIGALAPLEQLPATSSNAIDLDDLVAVAQAPAATVAALAPLVPVTQAPSRAEVALGGLTPVEVGAATAELGLGGLTAVGIPASTAVLMARAMAALAQGAASGDLVLLGLTPLAQLPAAEGEAPGILIAPPDRFVRFGHAGARERTLDFSQPDRHVPVRFNTGA